MNSLRIPRLPSIVGSIVGLAFLAFLAWKASDTARLLGTSGAIELARNGIVLGSLYALIALGYSMVYGILKLLNFAHGDVYMIGAFIGYGMITMFGGVAGLSISVWLLLAIMFVVAMVE